MSRHCNLWVNSFGDRLDARDFFFDAADCSYYLTHSPQEAVHGRPDRTPHEFYNIGNSHSMVDVNARPLRGSAADRVRIDTHVWFTLNDVTKADQWLNECVAAAVEWLGARQGDAHFRVLQSPLLERRAGSVVVNSEAHDWLASNALNEPVADKLMSLLFRLLEDKTMAFQMAKIPLD